MKLEQVQEFSRAKKICGDDSQTDFQYAFCSDLMSDVLTSDADNALLITGLISAQTVRTAQMADINCIIFARNKAITSDIVQLAEQNQIVLLQSPCTVFETCGLLFQAGIQPVY